MLRLCVVPLVASFFITFTTQRGIATPSPSNAIVNVLKRLPVGKAAREITTKAQLVGLTALLTATLTTVQLPAHEVAQQPAANRVQLDRQESEIDFDFDAVHKKAAEDMLREYELEANEIIASTRRDITTLLGVDPATVILLPRPPILPRDATISEGQLPAKFYDGMIVHQHLNGTSFVGTASHSPRDSDVLSIASYIDDTMPAKVTPLAQLSGVDILNHPAVGATVIFAPDFALPLAGEPTWGSFPRILDGGDLQYLYGEVEVVFSDGYYLVNVTHNYYDAPGAFARNFRTIVHSSNIEAYDD